MRINHELQRVAQVASALAQGLALRDRAGNFFNPSHKPSVAVRLDDGVVTLLHVVNDNNALRRRQVTNYFVARELLREVARARLTVELKRSMILDARAGCSRTTSMRRSLVRA